MVQCCALSDLSPVQGSLTATPKTFDVDYYTVSLSDSFALVTRTSAYLLLPPTQLHTNDYNMGGTMDLTLLSWGCRAS